MRSSRTPARAAVLLAVLALLATGLGLVGPAHAEVERHRDPARDVTRFDDAPPGGVRVSSPRADVVRFTTRHGRRSVTITTGLRRLTRDGIELLLTLRTPHTDYDVYAHADRGPGSITLSSSTGRAPSPGVAGDQECDGAAVTGSAGTDRVTMVIPRACLGDPRWVRTGGTALLETSRVFRVDDVRQQGVERREPRLGPRVRMG